MCVEVMRVLCGVRALSVCGGHAGRPVLCQQLVHHLLERVGRVCEQDDGRAAGASCRVLHELSCAVREQHQDKGGERDEAVQDVFHQLTRVRMALGLITVV